ncbi:PfkB family carbohydrate kinase [Candidatus Riesia pediculicola]|uniref:Bifunctional protein HldE n=1 Tax=Riesia pediculicola (strain USDA) TaxID=515618 RepID=D4G908_RIEPU|nr:PfkB family carbohydrate kinase [Candidatus Riesia pediculicola]ADD79414.1 bifunctional protein HldE [Candidatus Riesia pediculicola USDA]ADD79906.1 bifunctional protein HldE [Candidatus Riesia pediculicola USDA]ARC54014.1 hypothetical protein AOE55_02585 [Candidatus Riesia pediculicola]ARC54017.1 hypothetical protein AOE55_02605 [Candidatus Riesia pediculicola]QOJ86640.1 adenylyltransferase/cytidyltransferase family protein [Candidatus Riesia pediculicola]
MKFSIPNFEKNRILVIGDIILDNYWYGITEKISKEAPIPTVNIKSRLSKLGGAANVAVNASRLGARVFLIGLVGNDESSEIVRSELVRLKILFDLIVLPNYLTVTKFRIFSKNQQIARMDFEEKIKEKCSEYVSYILEKVKKRISFAQVIVLSDYGKGALYETSKIIDLARNYKIPVLVDPYGKNFEKYKESTMLTPNLDEFELVVGKCSNNSEMEKKGFEMIRSLSLESILITLSEKGILLLSNKEHKLYLPSFVRNVKNVTGAGDTMIATLAVAFSSSELSLDQSCFLSNIAASIVVEKENTSDVSIEELKRRFYERSCRFFGILREDQIKNTVNICKFLKEKIVMVVGYLDEIHLTYVRYLNRARNFGDRLIVAINIDTSIERLKLKNTFYSTENTMEILLQLKSVDWIIPFKEKSPENIVRKIKPDVFISTKICSSWIENIFRYVGEVKILNFKDNRFYDENVKIV